MTKRIALLFAAFAALAALAATGCAETTAPAPSVAVSSPASYGQVYAQRRHLGWQQFCEQSWSVQQASALAAARGTDGWELVAMYNGVLCYKRPAGEPPPGPAHDFRPQRGPDYVPAVRDPGF